MVTSTIHPREEPGIYKEEERIEKKRDGACAVPSPWQQHILKSRTEQDGVCELGGGG